MNALNFVVVAEVLLKDRLHEIQSGLIKLNVANQFDESVVNSALVDLNEESAAELLQRLPTIVNALNPRDIMTIAHSLSTFEVEEPSEAWFN